MNSGFRNDRPANTVQSIGTVSRDRDTYTHKSDYNPVFSIIPVRVFSTARTYEDIYVDRGKVEE